MMDDEDVNPREEDTPSVADIELGFDANLAMSGPICGTIVLRRTVVFPFDAPGPDPLQCGRKVPS